MTEELLAKTVR